MKIIFTLFLSIILGNSVFCQKKMRLDIESTPSPLFRDPIFDGAADPTVIWNNTKEEWCIFYTQRRANLDLPGVEYCYGTQLGMSTSKDFGKTWKYGGTVKLPFGSNDTNTYWAPCVILDKKTNKYHLYVTYIKGIYSSWGGSPQILHFSSKNLVDWEYIGDLGIIGAIDPSVFQLPDGTWKMWFKDKNAHTSSATSKDLNKWKFNQVPEISNKSHEAPIVFRWKKKYFMITDPCYDDFTGLDCYESMDGVLWKYNNTILNRPGTRLDDNEQGRHPDVISIGEKVFVIYFTHPGRIYVNNKEVDESSQFRYRRSSLQIAELEIINGKISCNRDKYLMK